MRRLLLLCCILVVPSVRAEEPPVSDPSSDPNKPKLDETIVVTATRSERAVSEVPISTTVISEEAIEEAPATFVDDLLRTIPGVHMNLAGSASTITTGQRVSMHGLGGTRALVMLDGIPIHDPYYGTVQWQKVPMDSLRQVEVVRGGGASLFGNFALGGTINLLTRPVSESTVRADLAAGSSDLRHGTATIDHVVNDKVGVRLTHTRYESDGFYRFPNHGPVDILGWNDTWTTAGRVEYAPSDRTHTFLKTNVASIDVSQGTPVAYDKRDVFDVATGVQRALGSSGLFSATVFYLKQDEKATSGTTIGQRESEFLSQLSVIPSNQLGLSLEWSASRSGVIPFVSVGVDVQRIEAEEERFTWNRSGALTQRGTLTGSQQFAGVYGQASWRPMERLEILASARFDYYKNYDGSDLIVNGTQTYYDEATSTQLDPRVSFRYALGQKTALRGAAYRAFKAPTLRDLYRSNQTGTSVILGNAFLEPETLIGAEVGFEWANERAHIEANLYRSDIEGLQGRAHVPGQPPNVFRNLNLGKSKSQGIEFMGNFRFSQWLAADLGYTYADSTIVEDPSPDLVGKLIPEVVPHIGSLGLRFTARDATVASVRYRVLSTSYGDAANLAVTPAHRVLDLAISRPLLAWLDGYATLENALDESYHYALTPTALRSGQPRTLTLGVRFSVPTVRNQG